MPTLYILRGLPGSGKSTLGEKLAPGRCIAADDYFMSDGVYKFDIAALGDAHAYCQKRVDSLMSDDFNQDVAVANTSVRFIHLEPYLKLVQKHNWSFQIIHAEFAGKIVDGKISPYQNVHGCPDAQIQKMKSQWENW